MKVKKEIYEEVCDFCHNPKSGTCELCGNDICDVHTLSLNSNDFNRIDFTWIYTNGFPIIRKFCPNHLNEELKIKYESYKTKQTNDKKTRFWRK